MADQAKGKGIAPKRASNPADSGQSSRPPPPIRPLDIKTLLLSLNTLKASVEDSYSRPIESKKEDVYNEFHALTFSTYKKGLSAFNAEFNGYLAKLTIAKIDIDPSLILNQYFKALESKFPSWEPGYRGKGKNKKKGKKKASYNVKGQNYSAKSAEQASFMLGSYNLAIEEEEESDSSSNSSSSSDSNTQLAQLLALKGYKKHNKPRRRPRDPALYNSWLYDTGSTDHISNSKERFTTFTPNTGQLRPINTGNSPVSPAGIGSITLEVLSRKAPPTYTKLVLDNVLYLPNIDINIFNTTKSIEPQRNKIVVEIPSNSIRKEDYRPIIEDAIVSEAIEPNKRYWLRNSPAKGTTLEGVGPSLRGKRPIGLIEIGPSKLEPYEPSSNSELDKPSPDKPINPVIVESTRPTISIRKPELPEAFP
ncbi:hypothetical protein P8C59_000902 [Phyllachora maydis]|uniref:Retrovirus-related Pol polyprotein from transposon TNT 1-94-like beta-barrel domain-containing protein n=1 Tax=Phyllachora maydis TaxID=1825666 RepID=A0AAD9MAU5_9PEZI|nr:hypothetical protein P8C59_000902 [Phyllachora maydis]